MANQAIDLSITPELFPKVLKYSQGDVGRVFQITLADYTLSGTETIKIVATKPSGFGFAVDVTSAVVGQVITVTTTATMTDEAGRFPAEIRITDSNDGILLGTANFYMEGEYDPHPDSVVDGDQGTVIPTLTLLVERVETAASNILDMTVTATTLAAGSDATYSYDSDTNTATFGIPRGADGSLASGVLASTYSTSSTYEEGEYVYYSGDLYCCTTAWETAGDFDSDYWTEVALADEVTDVKADLNHVLYNANTTSLWELGSISTSTGNNSSSTARIRTIDYIPNSVLELKIATGYRLLIFGWDASNVYQGCWSGSVFSTASTKKWSAGTVDVSSLSSYNLKICVERTDVATMTTSEATAITFVQLVDNTLLLSGVPADAKTTGERISAHDSELTILENSVDNLDEATFVYAYSQKTLSDISTASYTGYNAAVSGETTIGMGEHAAYDTYYWFAEKDTKLYIDASNVSYAAICIGVSPTTSDFVWESTSATLTCQSASRVRKSDDNLPTADNPIVIAKGTAIVITVPTGETCPVYLWEKTATAKVDTVISMGVTCNVQTNSVTITGESYEVVFSKLTTTQGYQWNITSLSGADGQNMFPTGVDIIGVIQFVGGSNFMGGGHGNESNYEFRVMADGADVSGTVVKDEIHIIMSSHLYDPDNTSSNVVDRFVEFVFTTKGWTCRNTFKVLIDTQIQVAYPSGLFAFTASDADGAYSNVGTLDLTSTSSRQLESTEFKEITINLTDKFTLNISSDTADKGWVTYRSNTTSFKVYFATAQEETVTAGTFISGKCEYRF